MERKAYYLKIAAEGIQKYICSTGKLKEMIGGSEIIRSLAEESFYEPLLAELGLREDREIAGNPDAYIVAQANAGALCLILQDQGKAAAFLESASSKLLAEFPGLPFFCALTDFDWADNASGRSAYSRARAKADDLISAQRSQMPVPQGSGLLPILRASRLDGLPAVCRDGDELVSLPSLARRNPRMIEKSRERLREDIKAPAGMELVWKDDLAELLGGESGKVALICMDGNDLGKLFHSRLEESGSLGLGASIRSMKELSNRIEACNRQAFNYACDRIARYEAMHGHRMGKPIIMPLRPLVMGGDDITIIARADIALLFVEEFTSKFDEAGKADKLSLGIGMVVIDSSYPFAKAFPLAESLQDSAKELTRHLPPGERPSSIDYLVLTEDVENDIEAVRQRLYTCPSGEILTGKPFVLKDKSLQGFLDSGMAVLACLPRSQIRGAWTICRNGQAAAKGAWLNLRDNIARGLGGRKGKLMGIKQFEAIFPENFFVKDAKTGKARTNLGDYLELERLLPGDVKAREDMLAVMAGTLGEVGANVRN